MSSAAAEIDSAVKAASEALDAHVREIVEWHFSPDTGTPYWLELAAARGIDPLRKVRNFAELLQCFEPFDGEVLRKEPHERFVPKGFAGRPFTIFETGGTTGMPKQRIGWEDYKTDYAQFSDTLGDEAFPRGSYWLMIGPTGPRRLRLAIEFLANHRGSSCYFVDLDPRWVKRLIRTGRGDQARDYMNHVVDQAATILRHRSVQVLFTTPKLLEALAERMSIPGAGIRGVFCGGTEMSPQTVRFLVEEVLENQTQLVPTYGNTLMGLAAHMPFGPENGYSVAYYAPQPRAVLRVVDGDDTTQLVDYDEWGRVELTTLTRELFLPRFLERDEGMRRRPTTRWPWDGVAEVRPFSKDRESIVEGVY